jgi:hypothetical protein
LLYSKGAIGGARGTVAGGVPQQGRVILTAAGSIAAERSIPSAPMERGNILSVAVLLDATQNHVRIGATRKQAL